LPEFQQDPEIQKRKNFPGHDSSGRNLLSNKIEDDAGAGSQLAVKDRGLRTVPSPVTGLKFGSTKNTWSPGTFPS
jgi:hypothetical protein